MTKRTAVERVAQEIGSKFRIDHDSRGARCKLCRLAAWHLSAVAKARGRTVGYVGVTLVDGKAKGVSGIERTLKPLEVGDALDSDDGRRRFEIARVVLVPRRRKEPK